MEPTETPLEGSPPYTKPHYAGKFADTDFAQSRLGSTGLDRNPFNDIIIRETDYGFEEESEPCSRS